MLRKALALLICSLVLSGCVCDVVQTAPVTDAPTTETTSPSTQATTVPETTAPTEPVFDPHAIAEAMSAEELIGQLFLARYPQSQDQALADLESYRLGGYILFAQDFASGTPDTIRSLTASLQAASTIPLLLAVDEEGGTVTRISRYSQYRETPFPSPRSLYETGSTQLLIQTEAEKSMLLHSLGINVNMAPVCDITTDPAAFMYSRSLGLPPQETASTVVAMLSTMGSNGISGVLKHFPGYADNRDTHVGIAVDSRPLDVLESADLVPFRAGIDSGCHAILISHTVVEALDPTLPASLSPSVVNYLREEMGFAGVIVTDDLSMQAITDRYGAGEAAVLAVLAGCNILCSTEYSLQYNAVLDAVKSGRIDIDLLRDSAARIICWKHALGLSNEP